MESCRHALRRRRDAQPHAGLAAALSYYFVMAFFSALIALAAIHCLFAGA
jgi:uncharacterized BrkB/YihY/UPF0761 family membrane protein